MQAAAAGDPTIKGLLDALDERPDRRWSERHVAEMGYDLSKVLFIATANNLGAIQPALLDRMELINVSGYTIEEKVEIAKRHLLPKQLKEHGVKADQIKIGKPQFEKIVPWRERDHQTS